MDIEINPDSSVSLRKQLLNQVRHLILSNQWRPGSRIPSETELQRRLNISRGTIRQALSEAEAEGLIERVAGKGTFVTLSSSAVESNRLIGYITSSLSNHFQSQLLNGAESAARAKGYRLLFCNSGQDINEENKLIAQLIDDRVRGILIWPVPGDDSSRQLFVLARHKLIPIVLMDRTFQDLTLCCDCVTSVNYTGGYQATKHLVTLGHQRIVFLSPPILDLLPIAERLRGYRAALQEAGIAPSEPWLVGITGQELRCSYTLRTYTAIAGPEIAQIIQHLAKPGCPTAIFAINDSLAMLALKAAEQLNLYVPEDLSIVGFDNDLEIATNLAVPLTTIAQDTFAMGKRAAKLLIKRIEGYNGPVYREHIPVTLITRTSTAPVFKVYHTRT
jgi:DNA-binding LacI/PurR family transcriptional regulator